MTDNAPAAPDTVVLVHGFWVTPRSWEKWIERYEGKGYRVIAPAYPGFEVEVEALREDPSPIEALTVPTITDHFEAVMDELDSPPVIIGHSAGGLMTQILLDHGYGAAGVAIDSVPAEGIRVVTRLADPLHLPDPEEPRQQTQGGRVHQGAVPLRLHQHPEPRGVRRGLRALPHPRLRQAGVGGAAGQLHARPPGDLRGFPERGPRAATVHSRERGQHHATRRSTSRTSSTTATPGAPPTTRSSKDARTTA